MRTAITWACWIAFAVGFIGGLALLVLHLQGQQDADVNHQIDVCLAADGHPAVTSGGTKVVCEL